MNENQPSLHQLREESRARTLACHRGMAFFSGPSFSSAKSSQASEQTTNSTSGSTSPIAGNSSPQNNGGVQNTAGGDLTVTADPTITAQAFDVVAELVKQALGQTTQVAQTVSDANAQNNNALNSVLSDVLSRDQAVAANSATGGSDGIQKTALYALGIIAASIVAFFAFFKKKS